MFKHAPRTLIFSLLVLLSAWQGWLAHAAGVVLHIKSDSATTETITLEQLKALGTETIPWMEHETSHTVEGVSLNTMLRHTGLKPGPEGKQVPKDEKRSGWKKVILARARDGYITAFSFAELAPEIGSAKAYVVWQIDGKSLNEKSGPLRLVVTTDKEPARCVYQLESLTIIDLRHYAAK